MSIPHVRKRELMCEAMAYAGELVRNVVSNYEAWGELSDEEQAFVDSYIVTIGDGMLRDAERRKARLPAKETP